MTTKLILNNKIKRLYASSSFAYQTLLTPCIYLIYHAKKKTTSTPLINNYNLKNNYIIGDSKPVLDQRTSSRSRVTRD